MRRLAVAQPQVGERGRRLFRLSQRLRLSVAAAARRAAAVAAAGRWPRRRSAEAPPLVQAAQAPARHGQEARPDVGAGGADVEGGSTVHGWLLRWRSLGLGVACRLAAAPSSASASALLFAASAALALGASSSSASAGGRRWGALPPASCKEESFYDILGVERGATEQEIKKAYKRAALKNHPDKAPDGEREAYEERFKRVSRAYEILSDPQKRRIYDAQGAAAFDGNDAGGPGGFGDAGSPFGPGADPFDMFRSMFGSQFGFSGGRRRTPDVGYAMEVTLEELYSGCTREVRYEQDKVCTTCRGQGATRVERCGTCSGSGVTITTRQMAPGYVVQQQHLCPSCRGHGVTIPPGSQCNSCGGQGVMQQQVKLPVRVPQNCPDRQRFTFPGKADEAPGMETGDIIIEVQVKPHETFSRLGDDLLMERRIPLLDALCGTRFAVRHLDGSELEIRSEEGKVVKPGDIWIVKGRGMKPGADLLVRFDVDFPERLPEGGAAGLRSQLRPLVDPSAPAEPGSAGGARQWFGMAGASASATPCTAARAGQRRAKEVKEKLAEQDHLAWFEKHERRGHRDSSAQCAQM